VKKTLVRSRRDLIKACAVSAPALLAMCQKLGASNSPSRQRLLRMGRATDDVAKDYQRIEATITYLASQLADIGIERGEVLLASDNRTATVMQYLRDGRLDLTIEGAFTSAQYVDAGVATPIAGAASDGRLSESSTVLFCRAENGRATVNDLKGKIIAFEDPESSSAYEHPRCWLNHRGLELVRVDSFSSKVPSHQIGYLFAGSEINISSWVFFGKVSAGALSVANWKNVQCVPLAYRSRLRVLAKTTGVPRLLVLARAKMDPGLRTRIQRHLAEMHLSPAGQAALKAYNTSQFIALQDQGRAALAGTHQLLEACQVQPKRL